MVLERDELVSRVLDARDLLSYQDGAVVSKTLIDEPQGTVTLFAFDEDQGLSEHTAPFDALVHALEGGAEVTISGKDHALAAGEMIIMPRGEPHAIRALAPFKMLLVMIRGSAG